MDIPTVTEEEVMDRPKYQIGDSLYCATFERKAEHVVCPDCNGTKVLRFIMWDETEHTIPCQGCVCGYNPPTGIVTVWKFDTRVEKIVITGMRVETDRPAEYHVGTDGFYRSFEEDKLFKTKDEAMEAGKVLAIQYEAEEEKRLNHKLKDHRSWAWHVHYYRKEIRDAEKKIEYATRQLNAAKGHVKDGK